MSTRFVSALIACILMLSVFSSNVAGAPLTSDGNSAIDASRPILETHTGPGEGSPYKVLGYGI
ncbi:uncharacterized protein ARMOST_20549 [Armillaria ostoyae]|uniref:Uncharacterized protein n=1 Tax=Armillaria ostoyae TaxID=47428 RepID=A0A284S7M3_ARMOS|nr:uncharacterized protein ARMOST_20549 [Armillaria ostoyae]